jgi:ATP-binding cassette subfamily B protein
MKILLRLKPYILKYKKLYLLGLLATLVGNVAAVSIPLILRSLIDEFSKNISSEVILRSILIIIAVVILACLCLFWMRQTIIVASRKIEYDLRNDFFGHLLSLDLKYFQNTPTGDLMAHATNDINAVRSVLGPAILYTPDAFFGFIFITTIMFFISPILTLITFIPLPFISISVYYISRQVHKRYGAVQAQFSQVTAKAQESLSGIRVVKSFVREKNEINLFQNISKDYFDKNINLAKVQSIMFPLMLFFVGTALVIVIWRGGAMIIEGALSFGSLTAFVMYLGWLSWPMMAVGWVANLVQQSAASMKRLAFIFDTKSELKNNESNVKGKVVERIDGNICFKNVSFKYKDDFPEVLNSISLDIPKGSTLAIIGGTGSSKSSLVNLITRLFDTTSGVVEIDGKDIKEIPIDILRKNIGFVSQETFLFSSSLRENIMFGVDNCTDDEFKNAVEISQIDKDVQTFQDKYDTIIGERGITLSGGQKQRVSIARAILRKPSILILDDAFSAVDTYTEESILTKLRSFMAERTSIIISHRISTVKNADSIIVLKNGKIVEMGNHDSLLEQKGIYFDLYTKQLLEKELEEL